MMKGLVKKTAMGVLAIAVVLSGGVSRPEVVKAGINSDGTGWDDDIWVFKIIPTRPTIATDEKILILTQTDVSEHWPVINEYNAKLLYDTFGYNEPVELFIGEYAYAFSDDDPRVKTVKIETECEDREGHSNPAGVLKIGGYAFNACHALTEIKCQSNVKIKTIDQRAFQFCNNLTTIDLTEVENIGNAAFYECEYLEKIKFNEIESIGDSAFYNCRSLQEVDFGDWDASTCSIAANAFNGVGSDGGENNPVLLLPADWTGDEPDENGYWYGGYFRYVKSMSITDETIILTEGEDKQLTAEASPIESENKAVTWSSSDESVATVDENGKVTAVSAGNATITVTSAIDERKTATCSVTVNHDFSEQPYEATEGGKHRQKCKYCDAYNEESHNYAADYTVDVEPTCKDAGSKSIHCTKCDEKKDVTALEALGHSWNEGEVTKEATYTEKGVKTFKCTRNGCTDTKTEEIDIIGNGLIAEKIDISKYRASNDTVNVGNKVYKPVPTLTLNGNKLRANKDYEVIYDDGHKDGFSEIGTYTITLKGINDYTGSVTSTFKIVDTKKYSIMSKAIVKGYEKSFKYDGAAKVQDPAKLTVKIGSETLTLNTDYTVEYINNKDAGIASMIIKAVEGSDKYAGEKVITYKILGTPVSKAKATFDGKNIFYTGKIIKPEVTVALKDGTKLTEGTDYTITYQKNVNAGTAAIVIEGKGAYSGTVKKTFKIKPLVLTNNKDIIAEPVGKATKNAKGKYEIEVAVKNNEKPLVKGTDYTISFKNNTKPGTATAVIKGKGNYTKTTTVTFEITE